MHPGITDPSKGDEAARDLPRPDLLLKKDHGEDQREKNVHLHDQCGEAGRHSEPHSDKEEGKLQGEDDDSIEGDAEKRGLRAFQKENSGNAGQKKSCEGEK